MSQEKVKLVHRAREAFDHRDFRALAELPTTIWRTRFETFA
jgi:hypothetical protein